VRKFMVERYLPGATSAHLDEVSTQLALASEELTSQGVAVRYHGSTFVPAEESCFCRFEGSSAEDVRLVCERAQVPFARIVEISDHGPGFGAREGIGAR
jgi:hypothetical protein